LAELLLERPAVLAVPVVLAELARCLVTSSEGAVPLIELRC
jgi:hypothetical protein